MTKLYLFHGSGAGHQSSFLSLFKEKLEASIGLKVDPITLDYMKEMEETGKKRPPPRLPKLVGEVSALLDPDQPMILLGKSMGSRIIADLCQTHNVKACVALGFPFYPAKKTEKHRLNHLQNCSGVPYLVLQGTRDSLGSKEWVSQQTLPENVMIEWLDGADHDFAVLKRYNLSQEQVMDWLIAQIKPFLKNLSLI